MRYCAVTHVTGVNTLQTVNCIGHVSAGAATGVNTFWLGSVPTATINTAAQVSRSVLINSASDVFLCVYLTSEKELEDKGSPPERKQRIYHANKTRLNWAAECHYRLQALGHLMRCRPKDRVISVRLLAETESFPFSTAPGQAVGPATPPLQGVDCV